MWKRAVYSNDYPSVSSDGGIVSGSGRGAMWSLRKSGKQSGPAKQSEAGAKEGGVKSASRGSGGDAETRYILALLEKIAYQTYHGPKTFDEYIKFVREYADKG